MGRRSLRDMFTEGLKNGRENISLYVNRETGKDVMVITVQTSTSVLLLNEDGTWEVKPITLR